MAPMSLPPGFRFHPTDEELVAYYLERKVTGRRIELEIIPEVDLYKCEPWDLPDKSFLPSKDNEWYFYSQRDRKYPNGSRTNRATKAGYWKATGKDRTVQSQKRPAGMKKTLVYYRGRAPLGIRTNWVMHEYRLIDSIYDGTAVSTLKDSYALCRVFKKTTQIPKVKEEEITNGDAGNELAWLSDGNLLGDVDSSSNNIGLSQEGEAEDDANFNQDFTKFPSDYTSSSDITQGTPVETGLSDYIPPPFAASDEANSSANLYHPNADCSSNIFQNIQMPTCCTSSLHYQLHYPPLALEDFPQINITEIPKQSEPETFDEYLNFDKYYASGTAMLDEILSLCSSDQDISIDLSMQV